MSHHRTTLTWKRNTPDFVYDTYDRTHSIRFEGGGEIKGSAASEYLGNSKLANPEELLVAALSGCHMLTFLAIAAKSRLTVDSYIDDAEGILEKNAEGKLAVTKVTLRPKVTFGGERPSVEKYRDLHEKSHKNCFIANSVKCDVQVEF